MTFGARLKEERRRLGFKQAEFAARVGRDVPKQSLYENDKRELRAPYLERIAQEGVDVLYVLTGRRSEDSLDEGASEFLGLYLELPAELQQALARLIADLGRLGERSGGGG
jgi:transcriptional regulator with XRE-family HTH domain